MKKIKSDNLLSFSAIFISICTLMVFLYQTNLIRKQQFMSVYPHLTFQNFGTLTKNYSFVLKNDGIGPAIIESVQVKTKTNETFEDLLPFVVDRIIKMQDSTIGFYHTNIYPGQLIPAESKIDLILTSDHTISTSKKLYNIINEDGMEVIISYKSIYDEQWSISSASNEPIKKQ